MEKDRAPFRAGDVVKHGPSGERWILFLRARLAELEAELDSAHDYIVEMQTTIARLGQSADMAYRRGAESMRERAVAECEARARYVQDADMTSAYELRTVAAAIRALPLDDDARNAARDAVRALGGEESE